MPVEIHIASPTDAALVAGLATALTSEIIERTGVQHFNVNLDEATQICARLIAAKSYVALVAAEASNPLGFAGLCESHALYTEGTFGIIQEFYVVPEVRYSGIGGVLLKRAIDYARSRGWRRLELCTPPLPEFDRSLAFYERNGFQVTGGRKMKYVL
jgi:GNAT superfamily N-acetyltransferase